MKDLARTILKFTRLTCIVTFSIISIFSARGLAQEASSVGTCSFQDLKLQAFSSAASGINDIGAVVGSFSTGLRTSTQAFLLFNGKFTPFTFPGSVSTGAFDINNHAQIVAPTQTATGATTASLSMREVFRPSTFPGPSMAPSQTALTIPVTLWEGFSAHRAGNAHSCCIGESLRSSDFPVPSPRRPPA